MRPSIFAGLVFLGLAAAGAAVLVPRSHSSDKMPSPATDAGASVSFHADMRDWAIAQSLKPGVKSIGIRVIRAGAARGDRLVLKVRDGNGRLLHRMAVRGEPGRPDRGSWDGITDDGKALAAGRYTLQLELERHGKAIARSQARPLTVLNLDLDADADRDGRVTEADEDGEDEVTDKAGAYFAVNYDADGGRRDETGQLLADSVVFDDRTGQPTRLDDRIENDADRDELAPLVIRAPGVPLPPGLRIILRVAEQEDIESIQVYARREAGARKIWGGLGSREGHNPLPREIDITRFLDPRSADFAGAGKAGDLTFAVEGLFFRNDPTVARQEIYPYPVVINAFDGDVDFYLEVRHTDNPGVALYSDHVRMRVVPWLMMPHTNESLAVFVSEADDENAALIDKAEAGYSQLSETGQLIRVGTNPVNEDEQDFRWLQDHAVLGAYHLPGSGADHRTYAALRLPYEVEEDVSQPKWVAEYLTGTDRGVFQFGSWLGSDHGAQDRAGGGHGGNIDVIPPSASWPLGRIVVGDTMPGGLRVFLKSQRAQPLVTLPTRWLAVGHIDEMIGFTGQAGETLIADPVLAYRLLEAIPQSERGSSVFFATGSAPLAGTVAAPGGNLSEKARLRRLDTGMDHRGSGMRYVRIYRDSGSRAAGQVARIAPGGLRNGYVLIDQVWDTATDILPAAKGVPSVMELFGIDDESEEYEVIEDTEWLTIPQPGDRFVMVQAIRFWFDGAPAVITVEEVLADERLRRLNTQNIAQRMSSVRGRLQREGGRNADGTPFLTFKGVPVIYVGVPGAKFVNARSAAGFTPNLANFQLVGDKLYMPRQFGPLGPDGRDIFETAARDSLGERVRFVDTWDAYHRQFGEVHCATNVLRHHFDFDWWTRAAHAADP